MMRLFFVGIVAALFAGVTPARAQVFHVTDLGAPAGGYTEAFGLNNNNEVCGWLSNDTSTGPVRGFLFTGGVLKDIGDLGGGWTWAFAMNDIGQITGRSMTAKNQQHAFIYENGAMTDLGTVPNGSESEGFAINSKGDVTGDADYQITSNTFGFHAFLYTGGQLMDLGTAGGFLYSTGLAINDSDEVAGELQSNNSSSAAFLYSNGQMVDIGGYQATGINNSGIVVGDKAAQDDESEAFVYMNGDLTAIGGLDSATGGINNNGVMTLIQSAGLSQPSFLSLYSVPNKTFVGGGMDSESASYSPSAGPINDLDQVAASEIINGQYHALLLTLDQTALSPTISTLAPSIVKSLKAFTLTVTGKGFTQQAYVDWNNTPLATTVVSATQLTAVAPSTVNSPYITNSYPGKVHIVVVNPGGASNSKSITINPIIPKITSISPSSVAVGYKNQFTLVVHGSSFISGDSINIGPVGTYTTFVSPTELTFVSPPGVFTTPGTYATVVTGFGEVSNSVPFTVMPTTISLKAGTPTRDPSTQAISVPVTLSNTGHATAPALNITLSTLGADGTTSTLPVSLGSLGVGKSAKATLVFDGSAGVSGGKATLAVTGVYTGGSFSDTGTVTLP